MLFGTARGNRTLVSYLASRRPSRLTTTVWSYRWDSNPHTYLTTGCAVLQTTAWYPLKELNLNRFGVNEARSPLRQAGIVFSCTVFIRRRFVSPWCERLTPPTQGDHHPTCCCVTTDQSFRFPVPSRASVLGTQLSTPNLSPVSPDHYAGSSLLPYRMSPWRAVNP